jgi:hypothetical protein
MPGRRHPERADPADRTLLLDGLENCGFEQGILRLEVPVEHTFGDTGSVGDVLRPERSEVGLGEQRLRNLMICARRSLAGSRLRVTLLPQP